MIRAALLLAALAASSCSRAVPTEAQPIELSAERPSGLLPLPSGHGGRLLIEITPLSVAGEGPVTVAVSPEGGKTVRFSLYPVDRPGRFAMRAPAKAGTASVSIEKGPAAAPKLAVRALPLER
jgi:hypothetical protein